MRRSTILTVAAFLGCVTAVGAAATLAGTEWVLASAGKRAPMIHFEAGGKVAGFGGCNRFFGGYQQSGESLTFSALGATRMACPGKAMTVEQDFFTMLSKVASAQMDGGKLLLMDATGKQIGVLSKK